MTREQMLTIAMEKYVEMIPKMIRMPERQEAKSFIASADYSTPTQIGSVHPPTPERD